MYRHKLGLCVKMYISCGKTASFEDKNCEKSQIYIMSAVFYFI